jgi:hypothetical protein
LLKRKKTKEKRLKDFFQNKKINGKKRLKKLKESKKKLQTNRKKPMMRTKLRKNCCKKNG